MRHNLDVKGIRTSVPGERDGDKPLPKSKTAVNIRGKGESLLEAAYLCGWGVSQRPVYHPPLLTTHPQAL